MVKCLIESSLLLIPVLTIAETFSASKRKNENGIKSKMNKDKGTIIFVHGAWHGKWCWDKYFRKEFSENGYKVVTFNLPGHSESGKIKGINSYSIKDYVNSLKEEVKKINELPIIIGHSMGGLILQKYLEKNTCKKAILLASVPPYGVINTTLRFARKSYFYPSLLGLNLYGLVDSEEKSREAFFSLNIGKAELKEYSRQLCSESFRAFLNMLIPRVKVTENSKIPILVLGGKNDTIFTENDNKKTANKFEADLIMVEDIAHDMMIDINYKRVSKEILNWLNKYK